MTSERQGRPGCRIHREYAGCHEAHPEPAYHPGQPAPADAVGDYSALGDGQAQHSDASQHKVDDLNDAEVAGSELAQRMPAQVEAITADGLHARHDGEDWARSYGEVQQSACTN
jgi:hypothetical protein